jgi:signal transduction histidine kinase/ligand-binding sensor domain-containing protein/DNA-binding response OmpR family regulator
MRFPFIYSALTVGACMLVAAQATAQPSAGPRQDASAHQYVAAAWTVDDGLQDRTGYLWITTLQGLARFDGIRFTVFTTGRAEGLPSSRIRRPTMAPDDDVWFRTEQGHVVRMRDGAFRHFEDASGLPDRSAGPLHVDPEGGVWVGTRTGVFRLVGDRFEPVAAATIETPVTALHADAEGALWVGTEDAGLYRVTSAETVHFEHVAGEPVGRVGVVLRDRAGTVWVATSNGLFRWAGGGPLEPVPVAGSPGVFDRTVADLRESPRDGTVWVAAEDGVWVVDEGGARRVALDPSGRATPQIRFGSDGVLWYALRDRLYRDGRLVFRLPDPGPDDVSANNQIREIEWDREGNVWVGTVRHGLFRLTPAAFRVIGVAEGLPDRNITVLLEDGPGGVWVGTRGAGYARIVDGRVVLTSEARGELAIITALMEDRNGVVWMGAGRLVGYCSAQARVCDPAPPMAGAPRIFALHQDATGAVWAGTNAGLFRIEAGVWRKLETGVADPSIVRAFLEREDGTLFMATNGAGVLAWRAGRFSSIRASDGLPTDLLRSLHLDRDGRLWVGTEGFGLARVTLAESPDGALALDTVRLVQREDGLADDVIHHMLEDGAGRLWMSSNRGIFWVGLDALRAFADGRSPRVQSTLYTEHDGLRSREANGGTFPPAIRTRDGRLWFATQNGVAIVDPATIHSDPAPPPVAIERVVTSARTLNTSDTALTLDPGERDIEIDYTALQLAAPANVRFRYRLEGLSDGWTEAGARRTAYFTRVPPGDYTFRVIAASAEGAWNETGATLALNVTPRFHETRAAQLLLALFALALLFASFQWRIRALRARERELTSTVDARTADLRRHERQLQAQNARLAELDQAKSRLFTNLSHEFRTPLTLILGPLRGLLEGRHGPLSSDARVQGDLMMRNGQRLLRLVNQVLDLSRLEAGHVTLDARPGDLVALARATTLAFSPLAERRAIHLGFEVSERTLTVAFDREQLEKVLLNLLSNALKFTPEGGTVEVSVDAAGGDALLVVRDTGIGIAPEDLPHVFDRFHQASRAETRRFEGTGIGLALAKELVELHGGGISVESVPGEGSTFTVRLPRAATAGSDEAGVLPGAGPDVGGVEDSIALGGDAPDAAGPEGEDRTTVLVVDDNADVRSYVRSVLAPTYRVIEAADGRAGLESARDALPDLIVADIMMPELDGLGLGRALKGDPMTDAIPLILLTARAAANDRVEGLRTGADAYLVKPFDPAVLEAQVANLLEGRRRLRERFRSGEAEPPRPEPAAAPAATEPSELGMRLRRLIEENLTDPGFGPHELAAAADLSYHQLYRGLRADLEMSPSRFIRTVRVEYAAELLRRRAGRVTEIGYSVGFDSFSYFSRAYRERFGVSPGQHLGAQEATRRT